MVTRAVAAAGVLALAGAVLALAGCGGPVVLTAGSVRATATGPGNVVTISTAGLSGAGPPRLNRAGLRRASLAVLTGAASVTVIAAAMPGKLLRAWTPAGSGVRPRLVAVNGQVQLFTVGTGQGGGGPDAVQVELSSSVAWQLQFSGGSSETTLDLGGGHVSAIDFTAGSSLISMSLPRPAGTVPITLAGGASQVDLAAPNGVQVWLRLYGGASQATLDGRTYTGLAGGTVLAPPGWAAASSRYDVDAPAGVSMMTVTG
jgi:hypothetical protein